MTHLVVLRRLELVVSHASVRERDGRHVPTYISMRFEARGSSNEMADTTKAKGCVEEVTVSAPGSSFYRKQKGSNFLPLLGVRLQRH